MERRAWNLGLQHLDNTSDRQKQRCQLGEVRGKKWMKNGSIKTSGYCRKHFYQSQTGAKASDISFIHGVSALITKFTSQLGK